MLQRITVSRVRKPTIEQKRRHRNWNDGEHDVDRPRWMDPESKRITLLKNPTTIHMHAHPTV